MSFTKYTNSSYNSISKKKKQSDQKWAEDLNRSSFPKKTYRWLTGT